MATLLPLLILYLIYRLDWYATGSYQMILACFLWGGGAVGISALIANAMLTSFRWLDMLMLSRFISPIIEEVLKSVLLIYLVRRPKFTYFVDGAIYGFALGMGFAIVENMIYLSNNPSAITALSRVFSTNLMHATVTSLIGITLGRAKFFRFSGRFITMVIGLSMAIVIHSGFNNLVTRVNGRLLLIYAISFGLVGLALVVWIIRQGLLEEKEWIEESLTATPNITAGEIAVVQQLNHVYDILSPLAKQFGAHKAQQIEAFLMLQARLGILQKASKKTQNDQLKKNMHRQLEQLNQQLETARQEIGTYCMVYLRNIFPPQGSPIWQLLEKRIKLQTQSSNQTDIWRTLRQRTERG